MVLKLKEVKIKTKHHFHKWLILVFIFAFFGCDFSPVIQSEILIAQQYLADQKYEKAVATYENIIKTNPTQLIKIKIYYQLGELYSIYLLDGLKARENYENIKENTEDLVWKIKAEEKLAELNFSLLKDYKAAKKNYEKLVSFEPKLSNQDFYENRLGLANLNDGDTKKSLEIFTKISQQTAHKYYTESFYNLGLTMFQDRKWEEAIKYWLEFLKRANKSSKTIETKFLIGNAYESMEKLKEAYEFYYTILNEYPNPAVIKSRLNNIYSRRIARKR